MPQTESRDVTYDESDITPGTDAAIRQVVSGEITTKRVQAYNEDMLREISSYEEAFSAALSIGEVEEAGTGFEIVKDKDALLGVPFIILQWRFEDGDYGPYVSSDIITQDGRKLVLNDGSTGIRDQLQRMGDRRREKGVAEMYAQTNVSAPRGLRKSTYPTPGEAKGTSTTYYLA